MAVKTRKMEYFLVLLFLVYAPAHSQLNPIVEEQIDVYVEEFMVSKHIPGMTLSIVAEENVYQKAYGYRNYEQKLEADEFTLFAIGSISKSFTSTIIAKTLAEHFPELGENALDIPIKQLLPSLNFTMSDRFRSENVNLRDLLAHRTCLRPDFLGFTTLPYVDEHEWHYRQRYAKEVCPFRTSFVYNNAMTNTASAIAEFIAGKPYSEMLTEFFNELGMSDSTFVKKTDDDEMPNRALAYYYKNNETHYFNSGLTRKVAIMLGSGGVLSNAADMARYMKFHLSYGLLDGNQIVPESVMKWLTRLSNAAVLDSTFDWDQYGVLSGDYGYGLSFFLGLHDGTQRISHGGNVGPFTSFMALYPQLNMGIFTSTNGPGNNMTFDSLYNSIFQLLKDGNVTEQTDIGKNHFNCLQYENPFFQKHALQLQSTNVALKRTRNSFVINNLENLVGNYGHPAYGEMTLTLRNRSVDLEQLYMEYGIWGHGWLLESQFSPTTFELEPTTDLAHEVYTFGLDEPVITLDFVSDDTVILQLLLDEPAEFKRDLFLGDLPQQPWDPSSCSPE